MKKYFLCYLLLLYVLSILAKNINETDSSIMVIDVSATPEESQLPENPEAPLEKEPVLQTFIKAEYPHDLQKKGIQGKVTLELLISEKGTVDSVTVVKGCHPQLDSNAVHAARQFVFSPAQTSSEPVAVLLEYEYRFSLSDVMVKNDTAINFSGTLLEKGTRYPIPDAFVTIEFEDTLSDTTLPVPFGYYLQTIGTYPRQTLEANKLITTTDSLGNFSFRGLPACSILVICIIPEYQKFWQREVISPAGELSVVYRPERESYSEYEVVVYGKSEEQTVSRRQLSKNEIKRIPGVGGDAVKVVQALPGVGRPTMGSGDVIIRGTRTWDSGFYLNGLRIPLLYHFDGIKSTYMAEALEGVNFYPGGTDVRHGGYTGGIVELLPRKARTDRLHGFAEVNLVDGSFYLEGPVHKKVSVMVSARRSFIGEVLATAFDKMEEWGENIPFWMLPFYWDYLVRSDIQINDAQSVTLSGFGAHDSISVISALQRGGSSEIEGAANRADQSTTFNMLSGNWKWKITNGAENSLEYGLTFNREHLALFGQFSTRRQGVLHNIHDELTWELSSKVTLYPGIDIALSPVDLMMVRPDGNGVVRADTTDNWLFGTVGAYLFAQVKPTDRLTLFPGVRFDYFPELDYTGSVVPQFWKYGKKSPVWRGAGEPSLRLAAQYKITPKQTLKAAVGNYSQTPQPIGWVIHPTWGNPKLPATKASQYVMGYLWNITDLLSIDWQVYTNFQWDIPRFDTTGANEGGQWVADVRGRMFGTELMVRYLNGKYLFGWLAYTFSHSERYIPSNKKWQLFEEDIPNYLQLVAGFHLPLGWDAGVRIQYATGKPQTPVVGRTLNENRQVFVPEYGKPLSERVDPYFTLGLRFDHVKAKKRFTYTVFLDIPDLLGAFYSSAEFYMYNYDYTEREAITMVPLIMGGIKVEY